MTTIRPRRNDIPVVFISSTSEDLKKYREACRDAALGAKFHPEMMESFTVSGARPPLAECLAKVSEADVLVVLVAHRYGWVPADQTGDGHKNITWLECEQAVHSELEVLAFVLDDQFSWHSELREENQVVVAVREGNATPELLATVQRSVTRLRDFKSWLNGRGIRALFTTPEDLRGKVSDALREWRSRHPEFAGRGFPQAYIREPEPELFAIQRHIIDEHARTFVGREYVEKELNHFLASQSRGYFIVRGEPGQGKTAFISHVVKTRGLVHQLISRTGGRGDVRLILRSLLAQLLARCPVALELPDTLPELTKILENHLAKLAIRQCGILLAIDALDELPDEAGPDLPFLVTEGLPVGVHFVVSSRPGSRLTALIKALRRFTVPHHEHALRPLELAEMQTILRVRRPSLTEAESERIADASQGNPLYLTAVADELERNPAFDLRDLPAAIEGFFQRAIGDLHETGNRLRRDVLGLLSAVRKPLAIRELSQITGERQRAVDEKGIQPIRQFLFQSQDRFSFYHARFGDFVTHELLYEDELPDYHRLIADWLQRPENRTLEYRWTSLAYHLFEAGDRSNFLTAIDEGFLREKVQRFGYAVLEDIELLSRAMLEARDPALVPRCVALVESLRNVIGGDLIGETRRAVQAYRPGPESFRSQVVAPPVLTVPGLDVYVGMLPKSEVGAEFFEVIPHGDRLVLAIGDAPGTGLKGAFVARFVGSVFRRLVMQANQLHLGDVLAEINRIVSVHEYFERISMQCVEVDLRTGSLTLVNAGHPYPVLCAARRRRCDRLPVRGDALHAQLYAGAPEPHYEPRRAEIGPRDILVLITDGLIEGHRLTNARYGYRFTQIVEQVAHQGAQSIGEAILDNWLAHPREGDYADDVTVLIVAPHRQHV